MNRVDSPIVFGIKLDYIRYENYSA